MFKWFRRLLNKPYEDTLKEIEHKLMPSNISEPVLSIVKTFEEKGRWRICGQADPLAIRGYNGEWYFCAKDVVTGEEYELTSGWYHSCFSGIYPYKYLCFPCNLKSHSLPSWMTQDEKAYVVNAFEVISKRIADRMELIEDRKKTRDRKQAKVNQEKERKRLMEVYCK